MWKNNYMLIFSLQRYKYLFILPNNYINICIYNYFFVPLQ